MVLFLNSDLKFLSQKGTNYLRMVGLYFPAVRVSLDWSNLVQSTNICYYKKGVQINSERLTLLKVPTF